MTTSTQEQVGAGRTHATFAPLRIAAVERLTADAVALTFEVPPELREQYAFAPGQHLTLRTTIDGEEVRRSYSICSPPSSGRLRIAVKRLEGGLFSGRTIQQAVVGDVLDVMRPAGRFGVRLDPDQAKRYAAIVAGSGITPVMSILAAALETEPASRFTLVYGNRDAGSVMFLEELADLKDRYPDRLQLVHVLSREERDAELLTGRIDDAKLDTLLDTLLPPDAVDEWLLCGPFELVEQVRARLLARGVPQRRVHLELFHVEGEPVPVRPGPRAGPRTPTAPRSRCAWTVGRRRSGCRRRGPCSTGPSRSATDAPYACKGGVCGTCRAKLVEGKVEMARHYALDDDELEEGFVLACQSVPVTPKVVFDFDA